MDNKGFTLVELMIVLGIIAILAIISLPLFMNYQNRSKSSEAKMQIGSIKTLQYAYKSENDTYVACSAYPNYSLTGAKVSWVDADSGNFTIINFQPSSSVYYSYEVVVDSAASGMGIFASADLNGDGTPGGFGFATAQAGNPAVIAITNATVPLANPLTNSAIGILTDMNPGEY